MSQTIVQVDAFTDTPFRGNPAAVCLTPGPVDEGWMKAVAREMNLSETAFLHPIDEGFSLRWFTPAVEVDLCGHATLASAHVLWQEGVIPASEPALFKTGSGMLSATRGDDGWITLDFPATPVIRAAQRSEIEALETALGTELRSAWMNAFDMLVELDSEAAVRGLRPDFTRLKRFAVRGIIATSRASTPGYDFVSRFFAPASGIDEDPVTGSAHCCLGPFWADRFDRTEFVAYQVSDRGGVVRVSVRGDRVLLGGRAVTVLRGELATEASPRLP
ncbi:MAG TPA: PhzF family phenazine biosynthesis protein [Isosphaeraceae bacterium]